MNRSEHFEAEVQDLLDGRLEESARAEVEAHLATCARCRRQLEALRWVRDAALPQLPIEPLPPGLAQRVAAALDDAGAQERRSPPRPAIPRPRRSLVIATALAAAAAVLFLISQSPGDDLASAVARDYRALQDRALPFEFESNDPAAIEAFFTARSVPFHSRVFDLAMMQYQLVGARVHDVNGRLSAFYAYRGPADRLLVCQMYLGSVAELPVPVETRVNDGIEFQVYRDGAVTLVFWEEGDIVCVLASDGPAEEVIQLAIAKAVKPEA